MKALILFLFLVLSLLPQAFAERQLLDRVAAVVNDDAITQSEMDMYLRPLYEDYKKTYQGQDLMIALDEARRKLLNQMIEDRLVFQEAKEKKIEVDEAELDQQMADFRKRFPSEQAMEDALRSEGLTLTSMRERMSRQGMIRQLQDMEIRSKIVISPVEVEKYYEAHAGDFSEQEQRKVRSITLTKADDAREKGLTDESAQKKIQELRGKVLSGEDFGALAKAFSQDTSAEKGGMGDWVKKGDMIPAIDEAIFKLRVGEISPVVETPMGYHLFRLEELKGGKKRTFEETREEIYALLFKEKAAKRFHDWMEELKKDAYISIR